VTRSAGPDAASVAAHLRLSTTRLARRLRRESGVDLTPSMAAALTTVAVNGPLTLGELAELEGVSPPTVTKVVARLTEAGLIVREPDAEDRRVCRVATSPAGARLLEASRDRRTAWLAERLARLDAADLATLDRASELIERLLADEATQ
jgi:DNA-binding MarR family transcriptional regulator